MRRFTLAALALAGWLSTGCVTRLFPYQPPDLSELRLDRRELDRLAAAHAGFPAVLLYAEDVLEHEVESGSGYWTAHGTFVRRYLVLDPHDSGAGTFSTRLRDQQRLTHLDILLLRPDGSSTRLGREAAVRQERGEGRVTYKVAYPAVTRGTLVEARAEFDYGDQTDEAMLLLDQPIQLSWPCLHRRVIFSYPDDWWARVKKNQPGGSRFESDASHGKVVLTWDRRDLPGRREKRFTPFPREDSEQAQLVITSFRVPRIHYYGATTPARLAKEYREWLSDRDSIFSTAVSKAAREATRGLTDPRARTDAVLEYVRKKIRLDEKYSKKSFARVLETGRGSPAQITGLAWRMLTSLGLDAEYLLIHSEAAGRFDPKFISDEEDYATAVSVQSGGERVLALPHRHFLPAGVLPAALQGRPAIRIGRDGYHGMLTTPVLGSEHSGSAEQVDVRLDGGAMEVEERRLLSGLEAYRLRRRIGDLAAPDLRPALRKELRAPEQAVQLIDAGAELRDATNAPLQVHFRYRIPGALTVNGSEALLRYQLLASSSPAVRSEVPRRRDVHVHRARSISRQIVIRLPEGWSARDLPRPQRISNDFGEASARWSAAGREIHIEQRLVLRRTEQPAARYRDLIKLLEVQRLDGPALVLQISGPAGT